MSIVRQGHWDHLAAMDVYPFPLAIEIRYLSEGWQIELAVVVEVSDAGHSSVKLASFERPYATDPNGAPDMSPEAADGMAKEAITYFATRLRDALRLDEASG